MIYKTNTVFNPYMPYTGQKIQSAIGTHIPSTARIYEHIPAEVIFEEIIENSKRTFAIGKLKYINKIKCLVCGEEIDLEQRCIKFRNGEFAHEECLNERAGKEIKELVAKVIAAKV